MTSADIFDTIVSLQAAVDKLLEELGSAAFSALSDDEFVEAAQEIEAVWNALACVDLPVVAEVDRRGLAESYTVRDAAGFLVGLHRITRGEARARARAARDLAPRATLIGEVLPPARPQIAAGLREGSFGVSATNEMLRILDDLPAGLPVEVMDWAETVLVDSARSMNATDLRAVGAKLNDTVDPDGPVPDEAEQQRRRDVTLKAHRDGTVTGSFRLDPVAGAKALAWFGQAAAPRKDDAGGRDERTAPQRRHDAFADLLSLAFRAGEFATSVGVQHGVQVAMTATQFRTGTGVVSTSMGQRITVAQAFRLMDEACVGWLVHNTQGGILNYGRSRRTATQHQADALFARDGGCAFPGCDHPAEWTERHHVQAWCEGGPTDIDNLVLLCSYHHHRILQQGWVIDMRGGVPWFIPPRFIDRQQLPLRNIRGLKSLSFA